jgi:adenylate cyclase class 2
MDIKNFEFKASIKNIDYYEKMLIELNPIFKGLDNQTDTYFNVNHGRLKLREGNIENALIHYERKNIKGSKASKVILYKHTPDIALKQILSLHLGIKIVVKKQRKIYFVDNVKIHFDQLDKLGDFLEVEAIDIDGNLSEEDLKKQCDFYFNFFKLKKEDLMKLSYSDMLKMKI